MDSGPEGRQSEPNSEAPGRLRWAIVSGTTYTEVAGGPDYTRQVARALAAAGDDVTVCAPLDSREQSDAGGVRLVALRRQFGPAALPKLEGALASIRPERVLVQYVAQAFGWKGMNVPFCLWLYARRHRYRICIMFHEVAVAWRRGQPLRHHVLATATHLMALLAARSATKVFISIPKWGEWLRPMLPQRQRLTWLPIPSNIPVIESPLDSLRARRSYAVDTEPLVGHFGTYGPAVAGPLANFLPRIMNDVPNSKILLLGTDSEVFQKRFAAAHPKLGNRLAASGPLSAADLSYHLAACDLLVQPYPDGISSRRTSAMAGLAHGVPMVTTVGHLTEPLWKESQTVLLSPVGDSEHLARQVKRLLDDEVERTRLGQAAKALYEARFALAHTIAALRAPLNT